MKKIILLSSLFFATLISNAQSAAGPYTVGTLGNNSSSNTYSWTVNSFTNPILASTGIVPVGGTTKGLNFTNFKFSVPATCTVIGVEVANGLYTGFSKDTITRLLINSVETGTNLSGMATLLNGCGGPGSKKFTYGSSTNMWGIGNITPAEVNSSGFGFVIYQKNITTASAIFGIINCPSYPSMTVYFVDLSGILESQTSSPQLYSFGKQLYLNNIVTTNSAIEVYNLIGEKIYETSIEKNQKQVDLSNLITGVYIYKLKFDGKEICKKFVVE